MRAITGKIRELALLPQLESKEKPNGPRGNESQREARLSQRMQTAADAQENYERNVDTGVRRLVRWIDHDGRVMVLKRPIKIYEDEYAKKDALKNREKEEKREMREQE